MLTSTQASYPKVVLPWLAGIGAAGSFNVASIIELDCPPWNFTLAGKLWLSFALSLAAALACGLVQLCARCRSRGVDPFAGDRASHNRRRFAGWQRAGTMTISLLNFVFLPTAQLAFSSMACTDTREPQSHLNLFSWVACDSDWRSTVLPPAILSALLSMAPLVPFAMLWRGRARGVAAAAGAAAAGEGDALVGAGGAEGGGRHDEFLLAVLAPFRAGFIDSVSWWEGALLLRRLLLVLIICFVPYDSSVR